MLGKRQRRLTVALVLLTGSVTWSVLLAPGTHSNAAVADGSTVRVSLHDISNAQAADSSYHSSISADGTQIAFTSQDALSGVDNGCCNTAVYVRNTTTNRTVQISLGGTSQTGPGGGTVYVPNGTGPNGDSDYASLSATGRYVSFVTEAFNIDGRSDTYNSSIVVCDRDPNGNGVFDEVVPAVTGGAPAHPDYLCWHVADVAKHVTGDPNDFGVDGWPRLSGDGQEVVWSERFVSTVSVNEVRTARLRQANGSYGTPATINTVTPPGNVATNVDQPQISQDGTHLAVHTQVATGTGSSISEYDLDSSGAPGTPRQIVSSTATAGGFTGSATTTVEHPSISDDLTSPAGVPLGSTIAFDAYDSASADFTPQAYVVARTSGSTFTAVRVSRPYTGPVGGGDGYYPSVSADGRYVVFVTDLPNMHEGKTGPLRSDSCIRPAPSEGPALPADRTWCQAVVRDLGTDAARAAVRETFLPAQLASPSIRTDCGTTLAAGEVCEGNYDSGFLPALSGNGARVAYDSDASDLVTGDDNLVCLDSECIQKGPARDVFVRTWTPSTVTASGVEFGTVALSQPATQNLTLTASGFGPVPIGNVTITGADPADFTILGSTCEGATLHDGETCAIQIEFAPGSAGTKGAIVTVRNPADTVTLVTATLGGIGSRTAPSTLANSDIQRTSVTDGSVLTGGGAQSPTGGSQSMISGDGRWDVFVSTGNLDNRATTVQNVFVRDLADPRHTRQLSLHDLLGANPARPSRPVASAGFARGTSPNGDSYRPSISADGRFVSFTTDATDIVPPTQTVPGSTGTYTVTVCDRDPSGARDPQGEPILDQPRPGTQVPDYVCYPIESGTPNQEGAGADRATTARLSADGTRIAWVQDKTASTGGSRVLVATLTTTPRGTLLRPSNLQYVPSTVEPFTDPPDNSQDPYPGDADQRTPVLSADGNRVVFAATNSDNLTAIIETDLAQVISDSTSVRLDVDPAHPTQFLGDVPGRTVGEPATSYDGTTVAFTASQPRIGSSVYLARRNGTTVTTGPGSVDNAGTLAQGRAPALSGDGRFLAFQTNALNMHNGKDGPTTGCQKNDPANRTACQIVARDLVRDAARRLAAQPALPGELVSASPPTCPKEPIGVCGGADANSGSPSLDATGSEVGFDSAADDLVPGDSGQTTDGTDAFVRTWRPALAGDPIAFGSVKLGQSANRTFTISASGFGPVSIGTLSITGSDATDFTLGTTTCAPVPSLNNGQSCAVSVTFTPSVAGPRSGMISAVTGTNSYPREDPLIARPLTGIGVKTKPQPTVPEFDATPTVLNFGAHRPLDLPGRTKTVAVSNPGTGTLVITGAVATDTTHPGSSGDYTVRAASCLAGVPAGGSCTISVTFLGHAVGQRDAVLVISDNVGSGTNLIGLIAAVRHPRLGVNPGVSPTGRVTIVSGTGFAPHRTVAVKLIGTIGTASVRTDRLGVFEVGLLIFPSAVQGPGTVSGRVVGASSTIRASAPLLVVPGSLESPRLVIRH